ncbi:hypothetical protein BJF78_05580 [Pseudonocardia sp. CNS-139]|nr:hypothetical protein BJF78_05580 [Pseudonocardia sp. CNS-139]
MKMSVVRRVWSSISMKSISPPTGKSSASGQSSSSALYDSSDAGARTRPSQRPYFRPGFQAIPAVVPAGLPVIVRMPFSVDAAAGVRMPWPAWPGPS